MAWMINKDKLDQLLTKLADYEIYGPVTGTDGTRFASLDEGQLDLDYANSAKPAKGLFFPQTQKMFDFEVEGRKVVGVTEPEAPSDPRLLFGIRPCGVRAITTLDRLFNWDFSDPYYNQVRDRSTLISFTCSQPGASCFCASVGGGPASQEGADMLWTDLGDSFFVEAFTDKGEQVAKLGGELFTPSGDDEAQQAAQVKADSLESFVRTVDIEAARNALKESFESDYWEALARRCLGCGICTLLCPTCHCFDINDVVSRGKMWRERTWDTCQFKYYTIHASGHDPRPVQRHRQRNRIYHKIAYMPERLGHDGCVGCGRCIAHCPVNIDIVQVLEDLQEEVRSRD